MIKHGIEIKTCSIIITQQSSGYYPMNNLLRGATNSPPHHGRAKPIINLKGGENEGMSKPHIQ